MHLLSCKKLKKSKTMTMLAVKTWLRLPRVFPKKGRLKRGRGEMLQTHTHIHTTVFLAMATCTSWVFACVLVHLCVCLSVCVCLCVFGARLRALICHKLTHTRTQSASQKDNDTWRAFTVSWQLTYGWLPLYVCVCVCARKLELSLRCDNPDKILRSIDKCSRNAPFCFCLLIIVGENLKWLAKLVSKTFTDKWL